jgi:tetratricopeptide (TPR) repeat protein
MTMRPEWVRGTLTSLIDKSENVVRSPIWGALLHYLVIPLLVPGAVVGLALLTRFARKVLFHYRQRGYPPIVIRATTDEYSIALAAKLSAHLVQEKLAADIVIPPGGGPSERPYPIEGLANPTWFAGLIRLVLAAQPTFNVHLQFLRQKIQDRAENHKAIVRITRTPGDRVLAADLLESHDEGELVHDVASLVIFTVRQDRKVLRHTPRWERWNQDIRAYSSYRKALELERQIKHRKALDMYSEATRYDPANFLVTARKAALLELMKAPSKAVNAYRTCKELWPETIEVTYRLAAAYSNMQNYELANEALDDIERRLRLPALWRAWAGTWTHSPGNAGERRYWRSWLRRKPLFFGLSKRTVYIKAARMARLARDMAMQVEKSTDAEAVSVLLTEARTETLSLLQTAARRTTRGQASVHVRLFHPACGAQGWSTSWHDDSWHGPNEAEDFDMRPVEKVRSKRKIGWLAHYNAAIFFSLALDLAQTHLPGGYHLSHWKTDCARAAIRELGYVKRDPRNELEPDWYRKDPGLDPLRNYMQQHGPRWAEFVGLKSNPKKTSR